MSGKLLLDVEVLGYLLLPLLVFGLGRFALSRYANLAYVKRIVGQASAKRPLYQRLGGYSLPDVKAHYALMDALSYRYQIKMLKTDNLFAVAYSIALAISVWWIPSIIAESNPNRLIEWLVNNESIIRISLLLLVGMTLLADWTENAALRKIVKLFSETTSPELTTQLVRRASMATQIKLLCFSLSYLGIVVLALQHRGQFIGA